MPSVRTLLRPLLHPLVTLGLAGLALASGLSLPATAQQHPNHVQGFQAERVYQLGDLDNINLFNGNLTVQIPLGIAYPAGGGLSYQLTLNYTGNVWEHDVWSDVGGVDRLMAGPRPSSNAGLGWQVSLGALDGVSGYRSPDGAEHAFTSQLNAGSRIDTAYSYSTDGTYLRLNSTVSPKILELPDGTRKHFDATGKLTRIDDRFATANSVVITYPSSATHTGLKDWKIVDSQGRIHWVYFKPAPAQASLYTGGVIDRVVVTAFDGTAATYTFGYTTASVTRGMTDPNMTCTYATTTLTVPLLASLTLPATDTSGNLSTYELAYDYGPYHAPCANGSGNLINTTDTSAHLTRMTLPTRGKIEWAWNEYMFPQHSARIDLRFGAGASWIEPFRQSAGVTQRTLTHQNGSPAGTWKYTQTLTDANQSITKVEDPQGHQTKHYFSVYACQPSFGQECPSQDPEPVSGWSYREYGLPFTRYTVNGTRFLSSEAYEGAESAPNLRRRHFVRYEASGEKRNQRVASTRTIFSDDASRWIDSDSTQFDGLGHYRSVVTADNFPGTVSRTVFTDYNPGKSLTVIPAPTDPWVLETYAYQQVTDHTSPVAQVAKTETCFDGVTGALGRSRSYKTGSTAGQTDVVVEYTRDARGQVTQEKYFGGDGATLGSTALCNLALSGLDYTITHTYQSGSLATSQYSGVTFKSVDRTIDADTGLVQTDRDVSALATSYEYDDLGRITYVKPAQDGWTQYVYNVPTASTPTAKAWIYRRPNQGGTPLATEEVHYDSFGRVDLERRTMPDSTVSERRTIYTTKGQLYSRTEWGSTARTEYLEYDAFGRPGRIRPPDGSAHDVTLSYTGVRQVTRTVKVGTAWNGSAVTETAAVTTERYDRDGRLYQVLEPANPDGTDSTTTYAYDVGGRLKSVSQTAKKGTTSSTQSRTFTYDNRGFLTSEKHPEKGASGNGTVLYWDYDARGSPARIQDGASDLTYTYDTAGRVTRVRETGAGFSACATSWTSGPRCLKEYTYGTSNVAGDSRLGKVQVAKRYNYPVLGSTTYTAIVNQTHTYGGKQGRVSARETSLTFGGGTTERFNQTWTWNDLGEVASVGYPQCNFSAYCTQTQPRTVSSTYTQGLLTAVPGYATAVSYHPNGQVNQVTRGNGVIDTYSKDPFNQGRPNKIETRLGTTVLWSSGVYAYDGAGNVTKTGASYYLYDGVSRVVSGTVYTATGGGATGPKPFSHTYDGFGNLQSMTTGTTRTTDTNAGTNRLTGAVSYDAAGNMTAWNSNGYQYDKLNQMSRMAAASGTETWLSMYDADGERVWSYKEGASPRFDRWTLRDLDGKVLRTYEASNYVWSWKEDHIYRGSTLIASVTPSGTTHLHTDHLGTVRAHTNSSGTRTAFHAYYPFGEEATAVNQNQQRMKFTSHERDLGDPASAADDLDYMHARHYNGQVGRFLGVDPGRDFEAPQPQSWNRYAYARSNPTKYVDPDGRAIETGWDAFNVGLGVASLVGNLAAGNYGGAVLDAGGILVDVGATVVPGVPGGAGSGIRAYRATRATQAATRLAANARFGQAFERAVLNAFEFSKNSERVVSVSGARAFRIPDGLDKGIVLEIKGESKLYATTQVKDLLAVAEQRGETLVFAVTKDTKFSKPFQKLIDDKRIVVVRFTPQ